MLGVTCTLPEESLAECVTVNRVGKAWLFLNGKRGGILGVGFFCIFFVFFCGVRVWVWEGLRVCVCGGVCDCGCLNLNSYWPNLMRNRPYWFCSLKRRMLSSRDSRPWYHLRTTPELSKKLDTACDVVMMAKWHAVVMVVMMKYVWEWHHCGDDDNDEVCVWECVVVRPTTLWKTTLKGPRPWQNWLNYDEVDIQNKLRWKWQIAIELSSRCYNWRPAGPWLGRFRAGPKSQRRSVGEDQTYRVCARLDDIGKLYFGGYMCFIGKRFSWMLALAVLCLHNMSFIGNHHNTNRYLTRTHARGIYGAIVLLTLCCFVPFQNKWLLRRPMIILPWNQFSNQYACMHEDNDQDICPASHKIIRAWPVFLNMKLSRVWRFAECCWCRTSTKEHTSDKNLCPASRFSQYAYAMDVVSDSTISQPIPLIYCKKKPDPQLFAVQNKST